VKAPNKFRQRDALKCAPAKSVRATPNLGVKMKFILSMGSLFFSLSLAAGEYTGAAKVSHFRTIDSSGSFVIIGGWDTARADGCTNTGKWVVGAHSNYSTPESLNSAYSAIMAAYMVDKTIELYIDGCNASGQPIVSTIWFPSRN